MFESIHPSVDAQHLPFPVAIAQVSSWQLERSMDYPVGSSASPQHVNPTVENHHFSWKKSLKKWWCSIVKLPEGRIFGVLTSSSHLHAMAYYSYEQKGSCLQGQTAKRRGGHHLLFAAKSGLNKNKLLPEYIVTSCLLAQIPADAHKKTVRHHWLETREYSVNMRVPKVSTYIITLVVVY